VTIRRDLVPTAQIPAWHRLVWQDQWETYIDGASGSITLSAPDDPSLYSARLTYGTIGPPGSALFRIPAAGLVAGTPRPSMQVLVLMSDPSAGTASLTDTYIYVALGDDASTTTPFGQLSTQGRRGYGEIDEDAGTASTTAADSVPMAADINAWRADIVAGSASVAGGITLSGRAWDALGDPSIEAALTATPGATTFSRPYAMPVAGNTRSTTGPPYFYLGAYPNIGTAGAYRDLAIYVADPRAAGLAAPSTI